jgi:membrane dipeptidase
MSLSEAPVIFSHSGVSAVCRHIRNIDDEQIRACAATGGVVGIVGIGAFLGDPQASTDCLFRHVDHAVQLVGARHVGIGTDFIDNLAPVWNAIRSAKEISWTDPYGTQLYEGIGFGPERLVELVEKMMTSGYPVDDIEGILGANFRRVYRAVEAPNRGITVP